MDRVKAASAYALRTTGKAIQTNKTTAEKNTRELTAVTGSIASLPPNTKKRATSSMIPLTAVSQKWI
jgi:hypothetical protein